MEQYAKYMDIILFNPDNGKPIIDVHEYHGVLPEEQTLDNPDVNKYHSDLAENKVSSKQLNDMLDNLMRQPAMESSYRRSGIKPEQINDFIAQVKRLPEIDKRHLIDMFWASYGKAAHAEEGYVNGKLIISGKKEWNDLGRELVNYPNLKNIIRSIEKRKAENQPAPKEEKLSFTQKVMRYIKDKALGTVKTLATGTCEDIKMAPVREAVRTDLKQMNMTKDPKTH